jgi:hypothetical protein
VSAGRRRPETASWSSPLSTLPSFEAARIKTPLTGTAEAYTGTEVALEGSSVHGVLSLPAYQQRRLALGLYYKTCDRRL